MKKRTYWLIFWSCIAGMTASQVLAFIAAYKFADTHDGSVMTPYLPATPLLIISTVVLVVLIVKKKPMEKASG